MKEESLKPPFSRPLSAKELAALPDADIYLSDIPETTAEWFAKARLVFPQGPKKQMTVRFDSDVVDWFRAKGRGYQTHMNAVLREYVKAQRK
jgi:uncharacterized protein (DUF4415 family)